MERSAYPKNLSSSRKCAIQDLLHGQNPTKKLRHLFDTHSQAGDNTGQHLFAEDLIVSVLRITSPTWTEVSSQLNDGYSWRKYGSKEIPGAKFPRSYYRCTYKLPQGCLATRQLQRMPDDSSDYKITHQRHHTSDEPHPQIPPLILESPYTGNNPSSSFSTPASLPSNNNQAASSDYYASIQICWGDLSPLVRPRGCDV
ncbi:probable WRKY transcription factor 53 [Eucalyptus grandis]|uniref:probable WRKY transcription factor 53 n=1 Tax=Eucalyptus grandis TaxID=71139 RepID=UPI00192EFFFB|nr:probable WRKY transcription factor 53 [Eucalyptus grandis]